MNAKEEITKMLMESYAQGVKDTQQTAVEALGQAYAAGAAAEREACAQVAEGFDACDPKHIAAAIRARGQDPMPLFDDWPGGFK